MPLCANLLIPLHMFFHLILWTTLSGRQITSTILQKRKLKHKAVEEFSQGSQPGEGAYGIWAQRVCLFRITHSVLASAGHHFLCYDHKQPPILNCTCYVPYMIANISQALFHFISKTTSSARHCPYWQMKKQGFGRDWWVVRGHTTSKLHNQD